MADSSSHYWFKRRRYGWGWIPTTWQGWLSLVLFVIVSVSLTIVIEWQINQDEYAGWAIVYIAWVAAWAAILLMICRVKGPKPKWRWGISHKDNPEEDY